MKTLLSVCALMLPLQLLADTLDPAHPRPQLEVGRYVMHLTFNEGGGFRDELHIDEIFLKPAKRISAPYPGYCANTFSVSEGVGYSVKGSVVSPGLFSVPILSDESCIFVEDTRYIVNLYFNLDEGRGLKNYLLELNLPPDADSITSSKGVLYEFIGITIIERGEFTLEKIR